MIFHPPVTLDEFASRKELAVHCYKVIAAGLAAALAGRGPGSEADIEGESEELMADDWRSEQRGGEEALHQDLWLPDERL